MVKAVYTFLIAVSLLFVATIGHVGYKIITGHAQDLDSHRVIIVKEEK